MSKAHIPPVPPATRSPHGAGSNPAAGDDLPAEVAQDNEACKNRNLDTQGRQGNIKQNTTNQGHQQDR